MNGNVEYEVDGFTSGNINVNGRGFSTNGKMFRYLLFIY